MTRRPILTVELDHRAPYGPSLPNDLMALGFGLLLFVLVVA